MHSPRQTQKKYYSNAALLAVGGTRNHASHLYGGQDHRDTNMTMSVVTYREVKSYVPATTSMGYDVKRMDTVAGSRRSDSTMQSYHAVDIATLVKRADRMDMTLVEYCEFIGHPITNVL